MTERLFVQTDGVLSYADIHDQVAGGLSQLIGAPTADVRTTHGTIAAAVDSALSGVLGTRQTTMQTTATSGTTIGELLKNAARMYEQGDLQGAEKLRAAAEAMAGGADAGGAGAGGATGSGGAGNAAPSGGTGAASSGGEMVGQMLGLVGQQVGQLGQSLSGLTQGLQQIPQQVMQGVQQATQAAQSEDDKAGEGRKESPAQEDSPHSGDDAPGAESGQADPRTEQPAGAAPGEPSAAGPAPDVAPRPAPTRPAVDESAP